MHASRFFMPTSKEAPADAELASHKLMLRAGLIRRLGSGLYTWLPMGLRVLRRVERVVREEMQRVGAQEVLMPAVQPAELWEESGRWHAFGAQMLKLHDRHARAFCFGPTHEEVVTDLVRREIHSYRQLPVTFFQVQTKFRDEIRPRFGVMRAREFTMKDAYSFHADAADLEREYRAMHAAYGRIFDRLGLRHRAVAADTGAIGGRGSHEFHVLADAGEDEIAYCPTSDYAANVEVAEALAPLDARAAPRLPMHEVATPDCKSIDAVAAFLDVAPRQVLKAIAVVADDAFALVLLRGDHALNEVKLSKCPGLGGFRFATEDEIALHTGSFAGYLGPVGLPASVRVIADRAVLAMADFVCGANRPGHHLTGVNFVRDLPLPTEVRDVRNVVAGDASPDGHGVLELCRGIEVGHVFQLGTRYSVAMNCTFQDATGTAQPMHMGCYGIGVSRIVAAAIEQHHDERGIVFPPAMAPFDVIVVALGHAGSERVRAAATQLHGALEATGLAVLLDDRDLRPGALFADAELLGIPYRVTVGERSLQRGCVEVQRRGSEARHDIPLDDAVSWIRQHMG